MNSHVRRELLTATLNPESKLDYVVTLKSRIGTAQASRQATVQLRYVPDKYILNQEAVQHYLDVLADGGWDTLEDLATLILHDMNNQVVARWVQVNVSKTATAQDSEHLHTVTIEDRQPNWDNPSLLTRLG